MEGAVWFFHSTSDVLGLPLIIEPKGRAHPTQVGGHGLYIKFVNILQVGGD